LFYVAGKNWLEIDGRMEISHKIKMATSDDGIHWAKTNRDIIPDYWGKDESQASPDVFYANGYYHMFFCGWLPSSFRLTKRRTIGYAYSNDLINWTRNDALVGISTSKSGWDSEMLAYPHLFAIDGETYMMYLGNEVGRYGFGLARLKGEMKP
jgi:hypothetical protein